MSDWRRFNLNRAAAEYINIKYLFICMWYNNNFRSFATEALHNHSRGSALSHTTVVKDLRVLPALCFNARYHNIFALFFVAGFRRRPNGSRSKEEANVGAPLWTRALIYRSPDSILVESTKQHCTCLHER